MKKIFIIICCIIPILIISNQLKKIHNSEENIGYFDEYGEYKINDGKFSIKKISSDEIILYSDNIEIILNTQITRIGWNEDYIVILKEADNYCIINYQNNEIIHDLNRQEYIKKSADLKLSKVKLRTIGRYIPEDDRNPE